MQLPSLGQQVLSNGNTRDTLPEQLHLTILMPLTPNVNSISVVMVMDILAKGLIAVAKIQKRL